MAKEIAIGVETYNFAACAESRVNPHYGFCSEWGSQQKLMKVVGKSSDGGGVGFLFREGFNFGGN
jgi:hypothetical protein